MSVSLAPSTSAAPPYQSSTGLASGLQDASIIQSLVGLKEVPITQLQTQEQTDNSYVSTYGGFASALASLQSVTDGLATNGLQAATVTSQNTSFSATTTASAQPGQYQVQVTGLAQPAKALSQEFSTAQDALSAGTINIGVGNGNYTVNVTDDMQLDDVAQAINSSGAPVTASVINTGSGYYLSVATLNDGYTSGETQASALTMSETTSDSNGASLNMGITQQATNAEFSIDNLNYTRQSNVITDAISGVSLTLNAAGSTETLALTANEAASQQQLQNYVTAYNSIQTDLNQMLAAPTSSGGTAGPMSGDATLESLQIALEGLSSTQVPGQSGVTSLADLGVTTAQDGTLTIDATTFQQGFAANPVAANAIFSQSNTGLSAVVDNLVSMYTAPTTGILAIREAGLQTDVTNLGNQVTQLQSGISAYQSQLQAEFDAMETTVSSIKNEGTFLTDNEAAFGIQTTSSTG